LHVQRQHSFKDKRTLLERHGIATNADQGKRNTGSIRREYMTQLSAVQEKRHLD